jgi:ABC-type bacteriocin/lantibiotic exporter with double-glycine peptidase domain
VREGKTAVFRQGHRFFIGPATLLIVRRRLGLCLAIALLSAPLCCATAVPAHPDAVIIKDVPFFSQEAYQCGPTALATVINYWYGKMGTDKRTDPERIASAIYSPSAGGVLGIDLERYAREKGFDTEQYSGSLDDLRRRVDLGFPPIIFVDRGFLSFQVNHFMVVTGYMKGRIIVNSGYRQNQPIPEGELEKTWKRNGHWTLVLKPSA